jgi:hypothetical protein
VLAASSVAVVMERSAEDAVEVTCTKAFILIVALSEFVDTMSVLVVDSTVLGVFVVSEAICSISVEPVVRLDSSAPLDVTSLGSVEVVVSIVVTLPSGRATN